MEVIRKDLVSKTYFELIYYAELYSSNYEEALKVFNKLLYENSVLTQEEKESCQERVLRNTEREKELFKRGEPIKCNNCNLTRYSTRYCENCIIKYLKSFFGTWTSGSKVIDEFICECQSNSGLPLHIMEWISPDQLEDITPLVKGGISTIYTATWKRGAILDFNESKREFVYNGPHKVVLKSLNTPGNPYETVFREAKKFIQIRSGDIVNAYGITKIKIPGEVYFWRIPKEVRAFDEINGNNLPLKSEVTVGSAWHLSRNRIRGETPHNRKKNFTASRLDLGVQLR
ncbi:26958_t:CDS:2, partial [Racocetra persica]